MAAGVPVLVLLLAGCGTGPKEFVSPYSDLSPFYPESVDRVAEVLARQNPPLAGIQAISDVTVDTPKEGKKSFTGNLLVKFPNEARLRASKGVIGAIFNVYSVGDQLHVYFNRDGVLFSGPRSDLDPSAGVLRLAGPNELMRALLAQRDLAEQLQKPGQWRVRDDITHWIFWSERPGGGWQIWVVRKKDFLVAETILSKTGEGATARIRYWKYKLFDGQPIPTDLDIHLANPDVTVNVEVDKVHLNPPFVATTFVPPAVDNAHWYPLSRLRLDPIEGD